MTGSRPLVFKNDSKHLGVNEHLAFVVRGAARVQIIVAHLGFERIAVPQFDRINRLHIVVAVNQNGRFVRPGLQPFGRHDRMAAGRIDLGVVQADRRELIDQPLGGALNVGLMIGQGADTGQ